jgi:RHS repeat-associated protein
VRGGLRCRWEGYAPLHLGRALGVALAALVGIWLLPSTARAEPLCTDTWSGPSEGEWGEATHWSTGHLPTSSDVACIGAGKTVKLTSGSGVAGVVEGSGSLKVEGRFVSLEIASALEVSAIANLTVEHQASLTAAGEVQVTSSFTAGTGAWLQGSGTITIQSGAAGSITAVSGSQNLNIEHVTFNNAGTLNVGQATLFMHGKVKLINSGTMIVNGESGASEGLLGEEGAITNTGTIEKTEGSWSTLVVPTMNNEGSILTTSGVLDFTGSGTAGSAHAGTWSASGTGTKILFDTLGTYSLGSSVTLNGTIEVYDGTVDAHEVEGSAAKVILNGIGLAGVGRLKLEGSSTSVLRELTITHVEERGGGVLAGTGTLYVTSNLTAGGFGVVEGSGRLVIEPGATATVTPTSATSLYIRGWLIENYSTLTVEKGSGIVMYPHSVLENLNTLIINGETSGEGHGLVFAAGPEPESRLENYGTLKKTEGTGKTPVTVWVYNYGQITPEVGQFEMPNTIELPEDVYGGEEDPATPNSEVEPCGEGVGCSSGNYSQTETDFAISGRGVGLTLTRTYNSQSAASGVHGIFGYGWTSSFSDHLVAEPSKHQITLEQANGGSVLFTEGSGKSFTAPAWTQDVLKGSSSSGYTLTLEDQTQYKFAGSSGRLESVTDRNGNETTLTYNGEGRLEKITDPAGRTIKLSYNGEGLVESAEDPMKHIVKYTYKSGNLASVTQPGEAGLRWQFEYGGSHQMTELTDGRSGHWHMEYNAQHQVTSQKDPMERQTTFEYQPFKTVSYNHATGAKTVEIFTSTGLPVMRTRGYETASATTETFDYDAAGQLLSSTDGDGHTTKYQYDSHQNRILKEDPEGNKTKWTYNSTHDVETETLPNGETTTYKRDSHGNPETIERPAPSSTIQSTSYKYTSHGQVESMTDPLKRTWKYEYDNAGDRTVETDPEGDKRTWGYNEDSQETSSVSPRGHVKAGEESKYTTTTERDAQGRPIKVTDPLKHETTYTYDGDGNLETKTDPEGNKTTYTYDADNERTKVKEPNGTVTETGYDGAGQVISQTDGDKHTTKYERNVLEEVTEVVDPLGRKTLKEYDAAGNLIKLTDPLKRTTTYKYDKDNRLIEVSYSDGKTPTAKYEYNSDGDRIKMEDGTGTTSYEYDQLDRLIKTKDGHGDTASYEYDLANEQTKITYPNGKSVTREYDNAGRLKSVTDWLEHTTTFSYNSDSELTATTFPTPTSDEDTYAYEADDAISEVKMTKGAETLASLVYTRNQDSQVTGTNSEGLPGEGKPAFTYDANNRLTQGFTTAYKYDAANNPTTIGGTTYKYDAADELEKAEASETTTATYTYDELGERTKTTPATGPATTYTYDQAGNLTGVTRPKEGETPAIEDTYSYNGDGLRQSQDISGETTYFTWDLAEKLPLVLNDGTNSYLYGPEDLPVEQINNSSGTVLYLHHDQQGSTRLLTSSTGAKAASFTYDAYGNQIGHTGTATSPFGYDGQYTSVDTGLIYLRSREYDPGTAQFLSVDSEVETTLQPYTYADDDPLTNKDLTGLMTESEFVHRWNREFAALNKKAEKLHIDIGAYDEYALVGFWRERLEIGEENEENSQEWGRNERAFEEQKARVNKIFFSDLSKFESLETADGPLDVLKTLLSVAAQVVGI